MGRIKRLTTAVAVCAVVAAMVPAAAVAAWDPTTTTLSPSPAPASTNQPVTLTATVTGETGVPAGAVTFADKGTAIPGCGYRPLTAAQGDTATATCTVGFAAATSPESLTATYRRVGRNVPSHTASPVALTIAKGATSTTLTASGTKPSIGTPVTYTALVIPAVTGVAQPYGHVEFLDGATVIATCISQPVSAGAATCITSYRTAGVHRITAHYLGDADFAGSRSGFLTVHAGTASSGAGPAPLPAVSKPAVGGATVKGRSATVPVSCSASGADCTLTARLLRITRSRRRVHHRLKTVTHTTVLASVKTTLAAGQNRNIKLRLSRKGRRLLARHHRLKLTLAVTDPIAHRTVARRSVTFKARR